jgi:hypothetical protein
MSVETARELLEAIQKYKIAADGDSGDAEHDAANEMADAADAFLISQAARSIELAELIDEYSGDPVNKFLNHYRCAHEGRSEFGQPVEEWDDESAAMNNDRCPVCNAEIEPYASEDIAS